jgi:hypothetical protein
MKAEAKAKGKAKEVKWLKGRTGEKAKEAKGAEKAK